MNQALFDNTVRQIKRKAASFQSLTIEKRLKYLKRLEEVIQNSASLKNFLIVEKLKSEITSSVSSATDFFALRYGLAQIYHDLYFSGNEQDFKIFDAMYYDLRAKNKKISYLKRYFAFYAKILGMPAIFGENLSDIRFFLQRHGQIVKGEALYEECGAA